MKTLKFAENGKRDIHGVESEFNNAFNQLRTTETWKHERNREVVINYLEACLIGEAKSHRRHRRVGKSWLYRVMGVLRRLSEEWLDKDFASVAEPDWKNFYRSMESDLFVNCYGKRFSASTKAKIYKTIKKFLKWHLGNDSDYPNFCQYWVTTEPIRARPHLTRGEIETMITAASTLRVKCMLMMLFDGGFRIEELGNLRWCDLNRKEDKNYYQVHIRPETSKTKRERYVSLYLSTKLIDAFHNAVRVSEEFNPSVFLFPLHYRSFYMTVKRIGKNTLGKDISPHILRHSSATYYANIIKTYQQFCSRYGWDLNSGTAQRYFHRVHDDEIAEQTKEHEISRFKTQFERTRLENQQLTSEVNRLREHQEQMDKRFDQLQEAIVRQGKSQVLAKLPEST